MRTSPLLLLGLRATPPVPAVFLFLSRAVFPDPGCSRMWKLGQARRLNAARCRRDFCFFDWIPRNVAKRYFAKWYLRAPLIHVNRRSSRFHSLFNLNYDKIIRALDVFVMPDLAALRTAAIQVDGSRV